MEPGKLITNESQLQSSNDGIANYQLVEVAPRPLAFGDSFFSSEVRFSYNNSGNQRSLENNSYIRARVNITNSANPGVRLTNRDMLAPGMNPLACMFQNVSWLAEGQTISNVSKNVAQVSALENRILNSGAQLDKSLNSLQLMEPRFEDRQNMVVSDPLTNMGEMEAAGKAYQVANINPLADTIAITTAGGTESILTYIDLADGDLDLRNYYKVGDWVSGNKLKGNNQFGTERFITQLVVVTQLTLQVSLGSFGGAFTHGAQLDSAVLDLRKLDRKRDVQQLEIVWRPPLGIFNSDVPTPAGKYELVMTPFDSAKAKSRFMESVGYASSTDYNVEIVSMYLYVAKINAPRVDTATVLLDIMETRCQTKTVRSSQNEEQEDFTVSPTTSALTVAFQDRRIDTDTRFSPSKFKSGNSDELKLIKYYVQYADMQRPMRIPQLKYADGVADLPADYLVQQYNDTILQTKAYFNEGSSESIEEWRERGAYYFLNYPRSSDSRATQVNLYYQFSENIDNMNVLLFSHTRKVATLSIRNSNIEKVSIDNI